jgi:hypothetical protein
VGGTALPIPVYSWMSDDAKKDYHFNGTSQTIVVSPNGEVLENIEGAYVGKNKASAENFFAMVFPGTASE